MPDILTPRIEHVEIACEGNRVVIVRNGQVILTLPWEQALQFARGVYVKAKQAEEQDNVLAIVRDQAILNRVGMGGVIGLSRRKDVRSESAKVAQFDRKLRRYLPQHKFGAPGGIESRGVAGTPSIKKEQPTAEQAERQKEYDRTRTH